MADFIVEQDINPNDGWIYTKYASGRCDLYGSVTATYANDYVLGGSKTFPFKLTFIYCVLGGMQSYGNSYFDCSTHEKVSASTTDNNVVAWVQSTNGGFTSSDSRVISVCVIGKYL